MLIIRKAAIKLLACPGGLEGGGKALVAVPLKKNRLPLPSEIMKKVMVKLMQKKSGSGSDEINRDPDPEQALLLIKIQIRIIQ